MAAKKKVIKKTKKEEFIADCACGTLAKVTSGKGITKSGVIEHVVCCTGKECWMGPVCKNKKEAIKSWNDVMAFIIHYELKHIESEEG